MMMKDVEEEELDSIAPQKQAGALDHQLLGAEELPAGNGSCWSIRHRSGRRRSKLLYLNGN